MKTKQFKMNSIELLFESDLLDGLLNIERRFGDSSSSGKDRIAVFDLDNTLLIGDIGNAVFAQLLNEGIQLPISWQRYEQMLHEDPYSAYIEVVRAMEGISLDYLIRTTKLVLNSKNDSIDIGEYKVPVPKAHPVMRELIYILSQWQYIIFVISASNDASAKVAASVLFDIPIHNVVGIKPAIINGKISSNILQPIPIGEGKVAQYRILSNDRIPMVAATDSEIDFPLLELCNPDGLIILVGENEVLYEKAKSLLPHTAQIHRVPDGNALTLQQHHRVA